MAATIYLVDDDPCFLEAETHCLRMAGLAPVRPFQSAQDFLAAYPPGQPGCLVTDLRLPGLDGLELAAHLSTQRPPLPVVFVTGHADVPTAVAAFKQGAVDFLEKPLQAAALVDSVRQALARDRRQRERAGQRARLEARYALLTGREREIFERLLDDEPAKRIAQRLRISPRTVEHHREHVMAKMQANSRHDLLVMGIVLGRHDPRLF